MKRTNLMLLIYWVSILIALTLIFGFSWKSFNLAFYFSLSLLPVVIVTTHIFNWYLVPKYLLKNQYLKFILYFFYVIIISLYLEMLVSVFSFVVIADTDQSKVDLDGISLFTLTITMYLIVFATGFIRFLYKYKKREQDLSELLLVKHKNEISTITVRSNRKNQLINLSKIIYVESLNDYIKIITDQSEFTSRKRISNLAQELPDYFVRIHRSFIVNNKRVKSFTSTNVFINNTSLPISRTYKDNALKKLRSS